MKKKNFKTNDAESVVSVDIGNITSISKSATELVTFESRCIDADEVHEFVNPEIFEIDGKSYVMGQGSFENNLVKHQKDNYIALLYYAIAKVTDSSNINLTIGVPAGQFKKERANIQKLIEDNNCKTIKINGEARVITINNIFVVPEGYGVKIEFFNKSKETTNVLQKGLKTLTIDIGGGTIDIAEFDENDRFANGKSITLGLLDLYKDVRDVIVNEHYYNVDLADVRKYFEGKLVIKNDNFEDDTSFIEPAISKFYLKFINELKGLYPRLEQYNLILCGGGADYTEEYFRESYPHALIVTDITANAKGFRKAGVAKWRQSE